MVANFVNACRRKIRFLSISAIAWTTLLVIYAPNAEKTKMDTAENSSLKPKASQNNEVFIPQIFLDDIPNIAPHNFRYMLQPDYDAACGVQPSGKENIKSSRSKRQVQAYTTATPTARKHETRNIPLLALFLVHSKAGHFQHRNIIRETWGSVGKRLSNLVFLLGNPQNETCQRIIEEENRNHGDILQEDFYETYTNITLKAVMALKWAGQYCPRAEYVIKVDDDMFVGTKRILSNIINKLIPRRKLLLCKPNVNSPVMRRGKYAVSKTLYAASEWPPFCFGGCWIASSDVIKKLYEASLVTPQVHLDDVFVTGILRTKIKQKISRAALNSKLFCHARGNPELVRRWWNNKDETSNRKVEKREKWMDCYH